MTFEEWWNRFILNFPQFDDLDFKLLAEIAWDGRDEHIERLENKLTEALSLLRMLETHLTPKPIRERIEALDD